VINGVRTKVRDEKLMDKDETLIGLRASTSPDK
jgi:hypothetical protein